MRLPVWTQLSLLVLLCSLLALMILALATWFQNHNYVTNLRVSSLSLTASLKSAQLSAFLLLYHDGVKSATSRAITVRFLERYANGTSTSADLAAAQKDITAALSGGGGNNFLLQARLFPGFANSAEGIYGLVNATGNGVAKSLKLPQNNSHGSPIYLGESALGYPSSLYPQLTYASMSTPDNYTTSTALYNSQPLYTNSTVFLGPYTVNESFSMFSITLPVLGDDDATLLDIILGWLTVVIDATLLYQVVESSLGLGRTGQIVLLGPDAIDNQFAVNLRQATPAEVANQTVRFVLPPQSNSTLGNRHLQRAQQSTAGLPFSIGAYPAALTAWTSLNDTNNNAGAFSHTKNEEDVQVSVGYALITSPSVNWLAIFEESYAEVIAPINHLRDVFIACVFGAVGGLMLIVFPLAYFSVRPIRELRAATSSAIDESSGSWKGSERGDDASGLTFFKHRKQGFWQRSFPLATLNTSNTSDSTTRRGSVRVPGKVPTRKHWVFDELTDLTSTFNVMSEELATRYDKLEERVRERTFQLERSKKLAEAANESKTLFIANISHELKTPLNGILGLCEVCVEEVDMKRIKSTLTTIYKQGDFLLSILTDLLTFSKNSAKQQFSIESTDFSIDDLSTMFAPIFEKQARDSEVRLKFLFEGPDGSIYGPQGTGKVKDMWLRGDKNKILQVLLNFTSNSLKFTPAGGSVKIRVKCVGPCDIRSSALSLCNPLSNQPSSETLHCSNLSTRGEVENLKGSSNSLTTGDTVDRRPDSNQRLNLQGGERLIAGRGTKKRLDLSEKLMGGQDSTPTQSLKSTNLIFDFEVEDTGPGIPEEQRQHIFEPFVQGDSGLSKKYGGTGLGLSICSQLAEAMGGKITLNSQVGVGSTFSMRLPLPYISSRCDSPSSLRENAKNAVDDEIIRHKDSSLSLTTTAGSNIIRTDHCSLKGDSLNAGACAAPLSESTETQEEKKTAKVEELEKVGTGEKPRILVAEDNKVNQDVLIRMLKLEKIQNVTIAQDGQEALDIIRTCVDEKSDPFDLVFMDVQMPNLDGISATKHIRALGFRPPIIAITAYSEKANRDECMASGMDFFLPKPIRRPALKEALKKFAISSGER